MNFKGLITLTILLMSTQAWSSKFSDGCAKKFEAYKDACARTVSACEKIEVCEYIQGKCDPDDIRDQNDCQDYNSCMAQKTPTYFRNVCSYQWDGKSCQNKNKIGREDVATFCPGFESDTTAQCAGQENQFKLTYRVCRMKELDYLRTCDMAGDRDRGNVRKEFCGFDFNY